jgi:tRNA A22 N-methylase
MKKGKHLRIRITENQFKVLTERIIEEQKTKSEIIREMIDDYIKICRKSTISEILEMNKTIKDFNNNNPKI